MILLIPAVLSDVKSLKDKTLKVTFETNELTPDQFMGIGSNLQQFGYLAFKKEPFTENEKKVIENLKSDYDDAKKTPSQRLRSVLYLNWQKESEGYKDFNLYYAFKLEQMISHFKTKLD